MVNALNKTAYNHYYKLWKHVLPPWSPSLEEIKFCSQTLDRLEEKVKRRLKVLVLGATPEFRDMLALKGHEITLLDILEPMHGAMTSIMRYKPKYEKLVIGNWLNADKVLENNYYDAVFCDRPFDNIKFKDYDKFILAVKNILNKNGMILFGITNHKFDEKISFKEYLKIFNSEESNFDLFSHRIIGLYDLAVSFGAYNEENYEVDWGLLKKEFLNECKKHKFSDEEVNKLWGMSDSYKYKIFDTFIEVLPPLDVVLGKIKKQFKMISIFEDKTKPYMKIKRFFHGNK